jgi:beta-lactamase class A
VGIVTLPDGRHMAVVVFVSDSKGTLQAREGVIARIARAGYAYWAR